MPLTTIDAAKDIQQTYLPLLLAVVTFPDGSVLRLCTNPLNVAEGGFQYGGSDYKGRILDMDLGAIQGFFEGGIDIVPRATLTLADADKHLLLDYEQTKGFKGARLSLDFVFWEADTSTFSSDSLRKFDGICDAAQADAEALSLSATSKLNLQRRSIPPVTLQRRCPWVFLATGAQRQDAADNEDSIFFECGYSPDASGGNARGNLNAGSPFTSCAYTKADCEARGMYVSDSGSRVTGRFGGVQYDPPLAGRSRDYTTGEWLDVRNNPNEARYGRPIPLVYGTAWVDAVCMPTQGDGNSTRGESIVCLGRVNYILRVVVNDVELQAATDINGNPYLVTDALQRYNVLNRGDRDGSPNLDVPYNGQGDPYGSMCAILWVVPRRRRRIDSTGASAGPDDHEGLHLPDQLFAGGNEQPDLGPDGPAGLGGPLLRRSRHRHVHCCGCGVRREHLLHRSVRQLSHPPALFLFSRRGAKAECRRRDPPRAPGLRRHSAAEYLHRHNSRSSSTARLPPSSRAPSPARTTTHPSRARTSQAARRTDSSPTISRRLSGATARAHCGW